MSTKLNLRARFPDGKTETLLGLSSDMTYTALLEQLKTVAKLRAPPQRVLVAGRPPRAIETECDAPLSSFLKTGDSLIVEPVGRTETAGPAASRGRRSKKTMVQKAEAQLNGGKRSGAARKRGRIATLDSLGKRGNGRQRKAQGVMVDADADDPRDKDWEEGGSDAEVKEVGAVGARRSKRKRRQATAGEGLGAGGFDPLGLQAAGEGIGVALAESLRKDEKRLDATGRKFRHGLQTALKEREAEAAGERRYAAWLAGRYRFAEVEEGAAFTVEVRAGDAWVADMAGEVVVAYGRELLAAAFQDVLDGEKAEEDRERLRAAEMAKVSARIFWNMVRLFPGDVEAGLKELVPAGDWGFLKGRRKFLTEKAKRNAKNKEEMGWESDC